MLLSWCINECLSTKALLLWIKTLLFRRIMIHFESSQVIWRQNTVALNQNTVVLYQKRMSLMKNTSSENFLFLTGTIDAGPGQDVPKVSQVSQNWKVDTGHHPSHAALKPDVVGHRWAQMKPRFQIANHAKDTNKWL